MSTEPADHLGPFKATGREQNIKIGRCDACGNTVLREIKAGESKKPQPPKRD